MLCTVVAFCLQIQANYLVVDGLLVGAHDGLGWSRPRDWPRNLHLPFAEVPPGVAAQSFVLGPSEDGSAIVSINKEVPGVFFTGKAWSPRAVSVATDRGTALAQAAQFARNRGIAHPRPYLTGVWDVDLDGDGINEQIIEAVSHPRVRRGASQKGDWQAVLLRWSDKKQERLYPLHFSFPSDGQELAECRMRGIADFEGDGRLEVITTSKQPSLFSVTLWSFANGKLIPTLDVNYQVDALPLR